ncbi:MAG TPA: hypothetical protein PK402_05555 [Tepidisphaeraceae bacterium]|nr:hypothetical protein [Tepidisphaeraceae bacterium]
MNRLISAFALAVTMIGFASVSFADSIAFTNRSDLEKDFPEAFRHNPFPLDIEVITALLSSPNVAQLPVPRVEARGKPESTAGTIGRFLGIKLYPDQRFANLPMFDPPPVTSPEPAIVEIDPLMFLGAPLIDDSEDVLFELDEWMEEMIARMQAARDIAPIALPDNLPSFLIDEEFTSASFAEAVNYFVEMGEEEAIRNLKGWSAAVWNSYGTQESAFKYDSGRLNQRLVLVCRVLFEPKDEKSLRRLPFDIYELHPSDLLRENWVHYPVANAGSSFFLPSMKFGYYCGGISTVEFMMLCESEGIFRTEKIPVPTREEALRDLELLITSPTWKSLTWAEKGPCLPDPIREDQIIARMKLQAESIEPKPSNYEPWTE